MAINKPEYFESDVVNNVDDQIKDYSEMNRLERQFINGIIRQTKPRKILEVGISSGSGTAIILNAIKDMPDSKLYSIDYNTQWYVNRNKLSGFLVMEKFDFLMDKWKLYTGASSSRFMEEIGGDIDLCIMDTVHWNPGEFLDFLMVFPFLKKNAIFILHDIQIFIPRNNDLKSLTCPTLFSVLKGEKFYIEDNDFGCGFSNIGAIILDTDYIRDNIEDLFFLLSFPWGYNIADSLHLDAIKLFNKYYDERLVLKYQQIILFNKNIKISNQTYNNLENKINHIENEVHNLKNIVINILNVLAWWIPVRKWRDDFRNKICRAEQSRAEHNIL